MLEAQAGAFAIPAGHVVPASAAPTEMWSSGQDPTVYHSTVPVVASGTVVGIDGGKRSVRLEHGSIRMIYHPPMTMEVGVGNAKLRSGLQSGQPIVFDLVEQIGQYAIARAR